MHRWHFKFIPIPEALIKTLGRPPQFSLPAFSHDVVFHCFHLTALMSPATEQTTNDAPPPDSTPLVLHSSNVLLQLILPFQRRTRAHERSNGHGPHVKVSPAAAVSQTPLPSQLLTCSEPGAASPSPFHSGGFHKV